MPDLASRKTTKAAPWPGVLAQNLAASLLLALLAYLYHVFLGSNLHEVVAGRVYRCAQLNAPDLEWYVRAHGIRTVVNLRGCCPDQDWYLEECRAANRADVCVEDLCMSAGRFPARQELRELIAILDHADYPLLIHCKQGADRTGLVSALVALLQSEGSLSDARWEMSLWNGHLALGRPANLDAFLDLYAAWLQERDQCHCGAALREWLANDAGQGPYRCRFEPLAFPRRVPPGRPVALQLRVHNTSRAAWRFQPESHAGIHAAYVLHRGDKFVHLGRAGLFDAVVPPGQSIDLTLALPALEPGRHRLFLDMIDEAHCQFYQTGSEPLEYELSVE